MNDYEELRSACAEAAPALLLKGIEEFNRREFFAAHETLEALWKAEPRPIRELYQGILQVGVAFYHAERANYVGASELVRRGLVRLRRLPAECQRVDVADLIAQAEAAAAEINRLGSRRVRELDPRLIPTVRLIDRALRRSGMELNLAAANAIIEACIAEAGTVGRQFSIAVVDAAGNLIATQRMDGAAILSPQIALGKAFGSAAFRREGPQLAQMGQNAAFANAVNQYAAGRFVPSLGAARLMNGETQVGAVGVSGAAPEQDQQVAEAGARAFAAGRA